jgi:hypothetical protein
MTARAGRLEPFKGQNQSANPQAKPNFTPFPPQTTAKVENFAFIGRKKFRFHFFLASFDVVGL